MYKIRKHNRIAAAGILHLPSSHFEINNTASSPDALLTHAPVTDIELPDSLLAIANVGCDLTGIPIGQCSERAVAVFHTPGANTNAVREMVLCALFLSSRDIIGGAERVRSMSRAGLTAETENEKTAFSGPEITGKTLGIIGFDEIGIGVANAAHYIGMDVLGYDPGDNGDNIDGLSRHIRRTHDISQVFAESHYITLHLPPSRYWRRTLMDMFSNMRQGVRLINFTSRELLDDDALISALNGGYVSCYVTDFPSEKLCAQKGVIALPGMGSLTPETMENCAVMACGELRDYLQFGIVKNSVNLPDLRLPYLTGYRICIVHRNIPHMIASISSIIGEASMNIENMLSKTKGSNGYTVADVSEIPGDALITKLRAVEGILRVRILKV